MIQAVDFATRFSAVILRDRNGEVHGQFDSRDMSPFAFVAKIARTAKECELTVIEDVPKGSMHQTDRTYRYQGVLMMACNQTLDNLFFLDPARWMWAFDGVKALGKAEAKGMTKPQILAKRNENMLAHAVRLGYSPPNLVQEWVDANPDKKLYATNRNALLKSMTDYVAAFLISEFVISMPREELVVLQGVDPAYI